MATRWSKPDFVLLNLRAVFYYAQLRAPYRLRGTSPVRSKGRKSFLSEEEYPRTTAASQPHYRSRYSKTNGQNPTETWGVDKRPWTVGELDGGSMDNLAAFAKAGKAGGLLRRVRSADSSSLGLSILHPQAGLDGSFERGDGDDCVEATAGAGAAAAAVSSAGPPQFVRRVSFADGGGGDFFLEELDDKNRRNSRRLSSLIDGGYSDIDLGHDRRASDVERQRHAMELVRAAHELMFTDTRPDGLRPITGSPMTDGKGAGGSGGLYVGLAGLRGFDLSFLGAGPTQGGERVPSRLSYRSAEVSAPAPTSTDDVRRGGSPPPASEVDVSWLEQGFLLGREPGSLMPTVPGDNSGLEKDSAASVGSSAGMEGGCGRRPLSPSSQGPTTSTGVMVVRECGGKSSTAENKDEGTKHLPVRRNRTEGGGASGVPVSREVAELNRPGVAAISIASASAEMSTEGMSTTVAGPTAAAALFSPQAAVLWSPANVSIDDLVLTVASRQDQEVSVSALFWARPRHALAVLL